MALSIVARAPSSRAYGYWPMALSIVEAENWKVSAYDGFTERNPRYRLDLLWIWCAAFAIGYQQGLDNQRVLCVCMQRAAGYFIMKINLWFKKARKVFSFSHLKAKQDQECGGKVCRNTKGSASCFTHVKAKQGFFFSGQSKARPRQAVIAKWQTKQWCKKGKISARQRSKKQVQHSVPWVSRVEGLTLREAPRYRFKQILKERLAALDAFDHMLQAAVCGVDNKTEHSGIPRAVHVLCQCVHSMGAPDHGPQLQRAVKKGAQGQHLCCTEAMMRRRGQRRCRPSFNAADNLAKLLGGA